MAGNLTQEQVISQLRGTNRAMTRVMNENIRLKEQNDDIRRQLQAAEDKFTLSEAKLKLKTENYRTEIRNLTNVIADLKRRLEASQTPALRAEPEPETTALHRKVDSLETLLRSLVANVTRDDAAPVSNSGSIRDEVTSMRAETPSHVQSIRDDIKELRTAVTLMDPGPHGTKASEAIVPAVEAAVQEVSSTIHTVIAEAFRQQTLSIESMVQRMLHESVLEHEVVEPRSPSKGVAVKANEAVPAGVSSIPTEMNSGSSNDPARSSSQEDVPRGHNLAPTKSQCDVCFAASDKLVQFWGSNICRYCHLREAP